jgi:hypothetical protein
MTTASGAFGDRPPARRRSSRALAALRRLVSRRNARCEHLHDSTTRYSAILRCRWTVILLSARLSFARHGSEGAGPQTFDSGARVDRNSPEKRGKPPPSERPVVCAVPTQRCLTKGYDRRRRMARATRRCNPQTTRPELLRAARRAPPGGNAAFRSRCSLIAKPTKTGRSKPAAGVGLGALEVGWLFAMSACSQHTEEPTEKVHKRFRKFTSARAIPVRAPDRPGQAAQPTERTRRGRRGEPCHR